MPMVSRWPGRRVLSTDNQTRCSRTSITFAVSTDSDGRFRTGQVRPGEWFLVASAKGHAPGDQRVKIGTAVPQVEITLGRPRPFKGRVVDPDGKPIAGAFVNPDTWRGYRCLGAFIWTDADGRFRWDDAPRDDLIVNVSQQGYRGVSQQQVAPSDEDVVFTLKPSSGFSATVRDAETQKRVENATVEYSAVDPVTGEPSSWTRMPELGSSTGVSMGNLDINFPVTADAYKFRVRSPGFQPFVSRTFKREEKVVTGYDISLVPGTAKPREPSRPCFAPTANRSSAPGLLEIQYGGSVQHPRWRRERGPRATVPRRSYRTRRDVLDPSIRTSPGYVLILGDDSYAVANEKSLEQSPKVQAKPYARIEGQCRIGSQPVPNRELALSGMIRVCRRCLQPSSSIKRRRPIRRAGSRFQNVVPASGMRIVRRDTRRGGRASGRSANRSTSSLARQPRPCSGARDGRSSAGSSHPRAGRCPSTSHDRSEAHIESNRPLTSLSA